MTHAPIGEVRKDAPVRVTMSVESDPLGMVARFGIRYRVADTGAFSSSTALVGRALEIPHAFVAAMRGPAAARAIADEISPLMDTPLARPATSPRPRHRTNVATRQRGPNRQTQSR